MFVLLLFLIIIILAVFIFTVSYLNCLTESSFVNILYSCLDQSGYFQMFRGTRKHFLHIF